MLILALPDITVNGYLWPRSDVPHALPMYLARMTVIEPWRIFGKDSRSTKSKPRRSGVCIHAGAGQTASTENSTGTRGCQCHQEPGLPGLFR